MIDSFFCLEGLVLRQLLFVLELEAHISFADLGCDLGNDS